MLRYVMAGDTINRRDVEELVTWLETNPRLTQGPLVREFERRWSAWAGTSFAAFVNSGSSANLLMYYAPMVAGRLRNRKVVVPAVAWATTVAPALQLGFEPLLCEADPATLGLDPGHLEALCEAHDPAAVVVVHILGVPADLEAILRLRDRYGFLLLEDACAATGSRYDGRRVGTFGDLSTFSFFFGHHLSTIEGGMVCTSDAELAEILVELRAHGWAKDLGEDRSRELSQAHGVIDFNRPFTFYHPGFNVRSTDLNARIGLSQLARVDHVVQRRAENHAVYQARFGSADGFACQHNDRAFVSSIAFVALAASVEHRGRVARALHRAGIDTRPLGGGNMSRQPFWRRRFPVMCLPVADRVHETAFQLPNHPGLSPVDIDAICETVLEVRP